MKGRRRVSWDRNKGGVKNFRWVSRACKELGKGKLGVGSNKLAAQQIISKSCLGTITVSPNTFEPGECSYKLVGPIPSADIYEKVGESPLVTSTSFGMSTQVVGGPVRSQLDWVQAELGGKSFSVRLRSSDNLTVIGIDPDSPTVDGLEVGTSSDGLVAAPMEFKSNFSAGFNSDRLAVAQMESFSVPPRSSDSLTVTGIDPDSPAVDGLEVGTSSDGLAVDPSGSALMTSRWFRARPSWQICNSRRQVLGRYP